MDMLTELGLTALALAFGAAVYAVVASVIGANGQRAAWLNSARRAALVTWPLISLAAGCLVVLLMAGRYEVQYVSQVSSRSMPIYLRATAWWGGQAGSILFWCWLMSAYVAALMRRRWEHDRDLLPAVIGVTMLTLAFFLGLSVFVENPFARWWGLPDGSIGAAVLRPPGAVPYEPLDGRGLNPLLRHPGMIIHPPLLYAGFVGFVVPYAFAVAALVSGRSDARWIRLTRRWTLVAWLCLALGLVLGSRWAYDVLGWGGYWGWDPVEIAALMPWLSGTAFLHSVMIQESRGMLKRWNMLLIMLTYALVIFGTFLTRSGVLSSVHAFAQSAIGPLFFAFIAVTSVASLALLVRRWDTLISERRLDSLLSREALFLANNLLFIGILVACFWGVIFPLISELVSGQTITVGPPFYEKTVGPLLAGLLLLMGIAPLAAWRQTTARLLGRAMWGPALAAAGLTVVVAIGGVRNPGALLGFGLATFVAAVTLLEFWRGARARRSARGESWPVALLNLAARNRQRYGGYVVHLGVVLMAVGILGVEFFQRETQVTLKRGEMLDIGPYSLRFDSLIEFQAADGRQVARATASVFERGRYVGELHPRRDYYAADQQAMSIPGVRSTWDEDVYVLLVAWEPATSDQATFKVYLNPLVNWLWTGAVVFIAGTAVAIWPEATSRTQRTQILHADERR